MAGSRRGVRLLDFEGRYEDDPFSKPRRVGAKVADVYKGLSDKGGHRRRKAVSVASYMRAASGSPEAVVKLASWGSGAASARDQLDYISREGELTLEMSDGTTLETREEIRELVDDWSDRFSHRKDGKARNTVHLVLSTPPDTDREATLDAARDWAEETFGDKHEYALVRHDDTEHPHVHIVAEVKGRDRSRFTVGPSDFHDMRERFAEKCRDRGIEMNATRRDVRGAARGESMALRKMREEGRTPRIDGIAQRKAAERGMRDTRSHPAKAQRQERFQYLAGQHRALAHQLSMGDLAVWDDQRPEQVKTAKALSRLARHLEQGGDRTRPDRVYDEVQRRDDPPQDRVAQLSPDSTPERTDKAVRVGAEHVSNALNVAIKLRDGLPEGATRDVVVAQIAVLEKSKAVMEERGRGVDGRDGDRTGVDDHAEQRGERRSPDSRPMNRSDRDLAEAYARLEREQLQRGAKASDRDRDDDRDR